MAGYKPTGLEMWDAWGIEHEDRLHVVHLQFRLPDSGRSEEEANHLGHAVSADLLEWTTMPLGLAPGTPGSMDDLRVWTGCLYKHNGIFYLYYTMRSSRDEGKMQRIGLATSGDMLHWERYAGNPVISPDPRWYVHEGDPLPGGVVDCRDLVIVDDPRCNGWYGFYAARTPSSRLTHGSVIAAVRSDDLIHWRHLPPAFAPDNYACIEVPDVYELDGKWYMTCLTGNGYGNLGIFRDRSVTHGTIYAVADHIAGPYRELPEDNLVIGGDMSSGYSCRSFMFQGKRHVLYTERETNTLSPPFELCTTAEGYLRLKYSERTARLRERPLIGPDAPPSIARLPCCHHIWRLPGGDWRLEGRTYTGGSLGGWQVADLGVGSSDMEIEATVRIVGGKAGGVVWRGDSAHVDCSDNMMAMLDAEEGIVRAAMAPHFAAGWSRLWPVRIGQDYRLRVMVRRPRVEVYVDDMLALQFAAPLPAAIRPSAALFLDRADVRIGEVAVYELKSTLKES